VSAAAFELRTRKPTCAVPWPQILLEGMEKSGKTWLCAEFSGSQRIGRTYWLEIGPAAGTADQYGAVPGARYEIVQHDGSWEEVYGAVLKIHQAAGEAVARGDKPTVLVVDVTGAIWDLLKDQVSARAAVSKTNRKRLAEDPAAELVIPRNLWNDATRRHNQIVTLFLTFPGIVLLTANGKEVSATGPDGQPLENKKDWRVDTQKELPAYVTCWVRMFREERASVIGARSVHAGVRPGHDEPTVLGKKWDLERLIFDHLALDPATAYVREFTELQTGVMSPQQIRDEACNPHTAFGRIRQLYAIAKDSGFDDVILQNETGDDENLLAMLFRIGNERRAAESRQPAQGQERVQDSAAVAQEAGAAGVDPEAEKAWFEAFYGRLAVSVSDDDWSLRRSEVESALASREITGKTAAELRDEIALRAAAEAGQAVPA